MDFMPSWTPGGFVALLLGLLGWFLLRYVNQIDQKIDENSENINNRVSETDEKIGVVERSIEDCKLLISNTNLKLSEFGSYVSATFAHKVDMQSSLQRVHEQIEKSSDRTAQLGQSIIERIDDLRKEVKNDIDNAVKRRQ